ncbi:MAG: flagellar motor switch phosphatase FliY [Lachnospiraceae bacterium]|nr:flagellar motor switch phosphatase FliY [Lachnospiraceae bacterium]
MDGVLSQEEINALFSDTIGSSNNSSVEDSLTDVEKDAIGEISNISMGTAATTLFSLVNRKVEISTPVVTFATWDDIVEAYERPCVFIRIAYTVGLDGSNILVLRDTDVKIITDLMMGGDGTNIDGELGELHLSAISEAMNQMMGSSATSLSSMLNKTIDISPPMADLVDMKENFDESAIDEFLTKPFVRITFRMEIGDLVDSEIMQLYPPSFAKEMYEAFMHTMDIGVPSVAEEPKSAPAPTPVASTPVASTPTPIPQQAPDMGTQMQGQPMMDSQMMGQPMMNPQMMGQPMMNPQMMGQSMMNPQMMGQPMMNSQMMAQPMMMAPQMMGGSQPMAQPMNVQPAQFAAFNSVPMGTYQPENIGLIMDVPLEVSVELGRTHKSIADILEFSPGKIIELDKLAGEPIDVLVNGKYVAKGEVVVIEESFGVRITEIINTLPVQ